MVGVRSVCLFRDGWVCVVRVRCVYMISVPCLKCVMVCLDLSVFKGAVGSLEKSRTYGA